MKATYDIYSMGLMMAFISFLGFSLENIWLAFTKGYIDNRNMRFPFLFGYGLLVTAMHLCLGTPSEFAAELFAAFKLSKRVGKVIYFISVMMIVSAGEIALGTFMEKMCHIEYWNYSWIPMHLTKYTSLPTSIGFTVVIAAFEEYCFLPVMQVIGQIPDIFRMPAAVILVSIMAADMMCSFAVMKRKKGFNDRWRLWLGKEERRLIWQKR